MQKCGRITIFLIAVLMTVSVLTGAVTSRAGLVLQDGTISQAIPVGTYEIRQTANGQEIYMEDFGRLLVPGKPNLPSRIFAIAIPPGAEVTQVTFDLGEGIVLPGTYEISPSSLPRVVGQEDPVLYEKDRLMYEENYNLVYGSDDPYPASVGEFVRTAGLRKYNLVDVRVTPFVYRPQSGQLTYYPQVTVNISYTFPKDFSSSQIMTDNQARKERFAQEIVLNYHQAQDWYPQVTGNKDSYDFVIITLPLLEASVTPLVNWETLKGRSVNVVTTTWINSNYTGYDLAEKMRNFLREKYPSEQWGIEDVLLVGDYGDVPMRRCWQDVGYGKPETDYYYAELSLPDASSWDSDGDHRWGEDSDPIDFYNEVNVGRIPWSSTSTVQHICEKSVAYEANEDPGFKKNMLLLGAFFWSDTDNAVLMEAKIDQIWMTDWTFTRMYEQGYSTYPSDYDLKYNNVRSVWSSGQYAFVNWAGHGSAYASYIKYSTGEAFVSTSTCSYLNDNYPAIVFADACSNSDTDYDNIGQMMLQQGAIGFLGATKVAYGCGAWSQPNDGSSQSLDYFFTRVTSQNYTQGEAHQWALTYMYTHNLWYYDKYEMFEWGALWGNPNLGMAPVVTNYPPETPTQPSGIVEGLPEVEYQFSGSTTDPDGDDLFYMFDWGDETNSGWLGPYASGETCNSSHTWSSSGVYDVMVKAKDINDSESDWSSSLYVAIYACGDCNDDGILDLSDAVYILNYLYKSGSAPDPLESGDTNGDDLLDLTDAIYILNYLYKGGSSPSC
jgi:hypothetical protein